MTNRYPATVSSRGSSSSSARHANGTTSRHRCSVAASDVSSVPTGRLSFSSLTASSLSCAINGPWEVSTLPGDCQGWPRRSQLPSWPRVVSCPLRAKARKPRGGLSSLPIHPVSGDFRVGEPGDSGQPETSSHAAKCAAVSDLEGAGARPWGEGSCFSQSASFQGRDDAAYTSP
jgi:hypothetical protein